MRIWVQRAEAQLEQQVRRRDRGDGEPGIALGQEMPRVVGVVRRLRVLALADVARVDDVDGQRGVGGGRHERGEPAGRPAPALAAAPANRRPIGGAVQARSAARRSPVEPCDPQAPLRQRRSTAGENRSLNSAHGQLPEVQRGEPSEVPPVRLLRRAPAAPPALPVREVRQTVTIIFCDLKGSTALGERLDPEAMHEVKDRYFTAMAAEITRHGGKIEKYIGDAIMAVFGLPRAARGRRAARGARRGRDAGGAGERQRGPAAALRRRRSPTAPASTPARSSPTTTRRADQKLATGDAVNVAARLEQAAPENEIFSASRPIGWCATPSRSRRSSRSS